MSLSVLKITYSDSGLHQHTCEDAEGKFMPSSFRDLMVAPIRLSCGSFWKSSAHSTIRVISFSHTLGWAYKGHANKQLVVALSSVFMPDRDIKTCPIKGL